MSFDASFWVAVAFVVFIGILYRAGAFGTLIRSLDDRSEQIRKELEEAKALRVEAQRVLSDYQNKFKAAELEADSIVAMARTEAEHYTQSVQAEFDAFMVVVARWPSNALRRPKLPRWRKCAVLQWMRQ